MPQRFSPLNDRIYRDTSHSGKITRAVYALTTRLVRNRVTGNSLENGLLLDTNLEILDATDFWADLRDNLLTVGERT